MSFLHSISAAKQQNCVTTNIWCGVRQTAQLTFSLPPALSHSLPSQIHNLVALVTYFSLSVVRQQQKE